MWKRLTTLSPTLWRARENSMFNKLCNVEDFTTLRDLLLAIFPHVPKREPKFPDAAQHRKYWEIAMTVHALQHFGIIDRDMLVLGVGAGVEATIFYLSNFVRWVFATDLYLESNPQMLINPGQFAPDGYAWDAQRLLTIHMDARALHFPDNTFDAIFSSSSIEHFGSFDQIAQATSEMGRVLKPGGVLTLATEFQVGGPNYGGDGWKGCVLFTRDTLQQYIIKASGCEPVTEFNDDLSEATRSEIIDLNKHLEHLNDPGVFSQQHILLENMGYLFTSAHLTLRKSATEKRNAKRK